MLDFQEFQLHVKHTKRWGLVMAIHARRASYYEPGEGREPKPAISFYMHLRDFAPQFRRETYLNVSDGYHKADIAGDYWTFYDFETPGGHAASGTREIAWRSVRIPRHVVEIFMRYARLKCRQLPEDERAEVEFTLAQRQRLLARYGDASGRVRVEVDARCQEKFDKHLGTQDFDEKLLQLRRIALATTRKWRDEAVLTFRPDSHGFTWAALTPDGRTSMAGGLIYHQPGVETYAVEINAPSGPHWSIHT
jgi:hypothetical protein